MDCHIVSHFTCSCLFNPWKENIESEISPRLITLHLRSYFNAQIERRMSEENDGFPFVIIWGRMYLSNGMHCGHAHPSFEGNDSLHYFLFSHDDCKSNNGWVFLLDNADYMALPLTTSTISSILFLLRFCCGCSSAFRTAVESLPSTL